MLEVNSFEKEGVTVVVLLEPTLIKDTTVQEIRRNIEELLTQQGVTRLLIDFRAVTLAGSATLGMLIRIKSKCAVNGCHLALCSLQPPVRETFRITQLDKIFEIYDDIEPGVAAMQSVPVAAG
jgi:anti-sigma B factor antagonist